MYARVASFAGDMSHVDDLIQRVRERMSQGGTVPGAKRFLMLLDREQGTSLGITFFESEEAIRAAEPAFERMAAEIPEAERGRRTALEVYEVELDDVADGARAARVSTLEGAPGEAIDEGVRFVSEQIAPEAREITGWRGILVLADRTSGRTKTITFWDGPESLRASEQRADELREQAAEAMKETIVGVDRYEVALHEAPVAA
jgi:heme-degrading monooxygenase HmoA